MCFSALSPRRITVPMLLLGIEAVSLFLFVMAKKIIAVQDTPLAFLQPITIHSAWCLTLLGAAACGLCAASWRSWEGGQTWNARRRAHAIFAALILLFTLLPLGNRIKHTTMFFEYWIWYGFLASVFLAFCGSLGLYLSLRRASLLAAIGARLRTALEMLESPRAHRRDGMLVGGVSLWMFAATACICHAVLGGIPHVQDSIAQLFQAKIFTHGWLTFPTPDLSPFFERIYVVMHEGRWYSIYPPGHALVESLGVWLHGAAWINPLTSAVIPWLFFAWARETHSCPVARLSVLLLAFSPFYLFMGSGFMNHPTALLFLLAYLALLHRAAASPLAIRRSWYAFFAGLAFGMTFLTRPMTALAFLVIGPLWASLACPQPLQRLLSLVPCFALGCAPPAGFYLYFNAVTTGSPWLTGYEKYFGGNPLGFGLRPWGKEPLGPQIPNAVVHTPLRGFANSLCNLNGLNYYLFLWPIPSLSFAAALFAPWSRRMRQDGLTLLSALSLLFVYFFYFFQDTCYGPRFLYETIPFWMVLTARGLFETRAAIERHADMHRLFSPRDLSHGLAYGAVIFFFLLGMGSLWIVQLQHLAHDYWSTPEETARLARATVEQDALLFVESDEDYAALFSSMDPEMKQGWIVAHDLGDAENQKLAARYPKWKTYRVRLQETDSPFHFRTVIEPYFLTSFEQSP